TQASGSGEVKLYGVVGQTFRAVAARDLTAQHRANGTMRVANGKLELNGCSVFDGVAGIIDQPEVERLVKAVVLRNHVAAADAGGHLRVEQNLAEVEPARFPVIDGFTHFHAVDAADHVVHAAEAKLCHQLPD